MVKYPRYIFRSELALQLIRDYVPKDSKFLEIGCADGELSSRIAKMGLAGDICDISEEAIKEAKKLIKERRVDKKLNVYNADLFAYKTAMRYDLIVMLEVLEHIENDKAALSKVNSLLKSGGFFLISVPAKKTLWGASDVLAGHFRRYDKEELKHKLEQSGFKILEIYSYGFPFLNILKLFRDFTASQRLKNKGAKTMIERSKRSGMNPTRVPLLEWLPVFNRSVLLPFIMFSNLLNSYDLAEGYLCLAKKNG